MVGRYLYGHIRCMGRFGIAAVVGLVLLLAPVARADVQTDLQHARDLFNAPDYPKAVDALQPLLADPTVGPEALHMMALCYQNRADYAKAITYYDLLFKDFPKSDLSGVVLKETRLACTTLAGDFKGAVAYAKTLIKDYPTAPQVPYWQLSIGQASATDKNWPEAIKALEAALAVAKEPADADLIKNVNEILAGCYEGGEEWEKLAKLSEDMVEKKPEEAAAWQRRASIGYERRGNYAEAIKSIEAAIKIATVSKDTALLKELNVRLPEMYRLSGRTEDAEKMRLKLATDDPANAAEHLFWYAMCAKNRKEFQTAADRFQRVADIYPDHLMGENALMEVYGCLIMVPGKKTEAEAAFQKLWDEHPDFRAEALYVKSEVHLVFTEDAAEAEKALKRLANEYPDSAAAKRPLFRDLLSSVYQKQGMPLEAAEQLLLMAQEAQNEEKKAALLQKTGELFVAAGRFATANKVYHRIIDMKKAGLLAKAEATYSLALCQKHEKRTQSATAYLRTLVRQYPETNWARKANGLLYVWGKLDVRGEQYPPGVADASTD